MFCAYVLGPSEVLELRLVGPDDYMRLVQVFRWIDGASWFDLSEPRVSFGLRQLREAVTL